VPDIICHLALSFPIRYHLIVFFNIANRKCQVKVTSGAKAYQAIKSLAKILNMTMSELCRESKVGFSAVWKWNAGRNSPTLHTLSKFNDVAKKHGVEFDL
jgi:predicted transcriptional regulator